MCQVHAVAAKPAFGQHRRDVGGERARAFARRIDDHPSEPRRQWQSAQRAAFFRDAAIVERAEFGKQRPRLGERALRRRIEEGELLRRRAPRREIEHER